MTPLTEDHDEGIVTERSRAGRNKSILLNQSSEVSYQAFNKYKMPHIANNNAAML